VSGNARVGLAVANRALTMKASLWEAEARQQRAEYLAALSAPQEEVEAELARALATAHRQGARSLELRTAASIVRSRQRWRDESALREARAALQAILTDMPEGRGTRDVCEAAALLG
jgi:predicted P-loop ATPase